MSGRDSMADVYVSAQGNQVEVGARVLWDEGRRVFAGRVTSFGPGGRLWVLVNKRGGGVEQRFVAAARVFIDHQPTLFEDGR